MAWRLIDTKLVVTLGVFSWNYVEGSLMKFKLGIQISPFILVEKLHLVEWGIGMVKCVLA